MANTLTTKIKSLKFRVEIQLDDSGNPGDWDVQEFPFLSEAIRYAKEKEAYYKYAWSIRIFMVEVRETEVDW